jgi:hypothetical protein
MNSEPIARKLIAKLQKSGRGKFAQLAKTINSGASPDQLQRER